MQSCHLQINTKDSYRIFGKKSLTYGRVDYKFLLPWKTSAHLKVLTLLKFVKGAKYVHKMINGWSYFYLHYKEYWSRDDALLFCWKELANLSFPTDNLIVYIFGLAFRESANVLETLIFVKKHLQKNSLIIVAYFNPDPVTR